MVENIIHPDASIVFVLESPHTDEVFHKYPLAGESGRAVSRHLFGRYDIPFGLVAKERELVTLLKLPLKQPYSIVNVSKEPFQEVAYTENNLAIPANLKLLESLKKSLENKGDMSTKHRDDKLNKLKASVYLNFKSDCEQRLPKKCRLIPCGRVAQKFCEYLKSNSKVLSITLLPGIPHPSWDLWSGLPEATLNSLRRWLK